MVFSTLHSATRYLHPPSPALSGQRMEGGDNGEEIEGLKKLMKYITISSGSVVMRHRRIRRN